MVKHLLTIFPAPGKNELSVKRGRDWTITPRTTTVTPKGQVCIIERLRAEQNRTA